MNFPNISSAQWMRYLACLAFLLAGACGPTFVSTNTSAVSATATTIGQDRLALPTAWLIIGDKHVAGTLAAGGTSQWHFDPALTIPEIKTAMLPAQAKVVVAIETNSLKSFTVTVRPWNRDGTIIPLVDGSARQLQVESQDTGSLTTITLDAIGNSDDQLLNVNLTLQDQWGFYLWRLNPHQ